VAKERVGGVLPYQYEGDSDASAMAALAGARQRIAAMAATGSG